MYCLKRTCLNFGRKNLFQSSVWIDCYQRKLFHCKIQSENLNKLANQSSLPSHLLRLNLVNRNEKKFYQRKIPPPSRSLASYLFLFFPIATFVLGTWQIKRLKWKKDLLAKIDAIIKNDPEEFPDDLTNISEKKYVKFKVKGYIDYSAKPKFLYPRSLIVDEEKEMSPKFLSATNDSSGNIGALLVLPFVVTEERLNNSEPFPILVNWGWINKKTMDRIIAESENPNLASITERSKPIVFDLVGVLRDSEKYGGKSHNQNYWHNRDIEGLAHEMGTNPIYLDAYESYSLKLWNNERFRIDPISKQIRLKLRNEHLSYIITWYSLSAILSYLWYFKIFKVRL